ncbi:hypothetical protein A4A49_51450 [Nicotiana attenuata]|uniref:DUF4283 domain-containing protein n=1 Tax=Nicotiana attenuata TaxID=49451 RepID=A0A314L133_NICAT|nr:hypothetical protein A4A49_51450 [Nicotiana attenuata]
MAEEITDRLQKFILTEEEKQAVAIEFSDIQSSIKDCEVSLFGKNAMPMAWGNPSDMQIKEEGWNSFQFVFKEKRSMDMVCFATSWLYDRFHPWKLGLKSDSHVFNMSLDVRHKIGHALGSTVDIVIPENGSKEGRYMRLKVWMDITKPLPRGKLIKLGLETTWVEDITIKLVYNEKRTYDQTNKNDQFGIWLKRPRGVNTNNGQTMVRNHNSKLVEGERVIETSKSVQNLDEGADPTNMQPDLGKEDLHEVHQNSLIGKRTMGLNGNNDDILNILDYIRGSPWSLLVFGIEVQLCYHELRVLGDCIDEEIIRLHNTEKTLPLVASQAHDIAPLHMTALRGNIDQATTIVHQMEVHTKTTDLQGTKDRISDDFEKGKDLKVPNEHLVKIVVTEDGMQTVGDKRKGATILINDIEAKNKKIMVEREASSKWLPSSQ